MDNIFHYIGKVFLTIAVAVAGIFGGGHVEAPQQNVGATIPVAVAVFQTSLQASITATATSMTLVTGTNKAGNALSGYICYNIDEGTAKEEFVCGSTTGTAVTSLVRGIDPVDGDLEVTALKKAHARGASVKITNYPSLGILSRILNGQETLPNPITYAAGVTPSASGDLTDKEYVLSVVSGGAVTFEKVVVAGTAGETLAAGNLVYLKASDGRWWLTDADTASTVENVVLGIAQGAGTAGNAIATGVLVKGTDANQSGLSASTVYYASNTAGGLSSSVGTKEVTIGVALSTTSILFAPRYNQQITEDEQDAIAGSLGTPSSTNKFITSQNTSSATLNQSQTTQNATTAVGEADTTTKRNLIGQSFTPTLPTISGVKLYKDTNTGTFTGTVKVALQADSAGSPSGSDLASVTITNAQYLALANGEFTAQFTTDYTTLTVGSLYWIVVTCSTADDSNRPNLGTNSAGGYANGSAKYKNTTDGWVVISTIDLYFKTIEGVQSQIVKTGTDGYIPTQITEPLRSRVFTYINTKDIAGATDTVSITHSLGRMPSLVKFTATLNFDNASLNVSNTFGTAIISAAGAPTYTTIYGVNSATSSLNGSVTNAIGIIAAGGASLADYQAATISAISEDKLDITFSKVSSPNVGPFYYLVEIFL